MSAIQKLHETSRCTATSNQQTIISKVNSVRILIGSCRLCLGGSFFWFG